MIDVVTVEHEPRLGELSVATFSPCSTYRYSLCRRWDTDRPVARFIMLNPSTADAFVDDATIRRCVGFARAWGCGGLLVLNLFAYRATAPKDMLAVADPVGPVNNAFLSALAADAASPVVAAWGAHGGHRGRDQQVLALLETARVRVQCLGVTGGGMPRHPLYLPNAATLTDYRLRADEGPGVVDTLGGHP